MRLYFCVIGIAASVGWASGQDRNKVSAETNAVLESSIVLDEANVVQGNTLLKIERLSTPDEEVIKALEAKKITSDQVESLDPVAASLKQESYFISAMVYDNTYSLLSFRSLSGNQPSEAKVWTNITSWNEMASSPKFIQGNTEYTMMIMPSAAQVTDDSPALPTNLPGLVEGGAYYQEGGEEALSAADVNFMEALHLYYGLKQRGIEIAHQKKIEEQLEKVTAEKAEAARKKTVTLRFWRQKDKPATPEASPSE